MSKQPGPASISININQFINKHPLVIECKKRAKALQKSLNQKNILMQCQNHVAKEMGYRDWFDLYHCVKQEVTLSNHSHDFSLNDQFEKMLNFAVQKNVTDIHIEKRKDFKIRMRLIGELFDCTEDFPEINNIDLLCQHILHIVAQTNQIAFKADKTFQQAMCEYTFATASYYLNIQKIQIYFQSLPVYPSGYDVVLKIKPFYDKKEYDLNRLGYNQSQIKMIQTIMQHRHGAFVLAGGTGSGLSTSIQNILADVNTSKKIASIDEHPENSLHNIDYIPIIREALNLSESYSPLTEPLQTVLNNHYEITHLNYRHLSEAQNLITQVIEQQLFISSLNASSSINIIDRLNDFGFDYTTIGKIDDNGNMATNRFEKKSFLSGLSYQRLCPVVCPHCSIKLVDVIEKGQANEAILAVASRIAKAYSNLKADSFNLITLRGSGCEHCKQMGITGRTVCAEIIVLNDEMRKAIQDNQKMQLYHLWKNSSDNNPLSENMQGKTAYEHAIYKMFSGLISPLDIENSFKPIGT